MFAENAFSEKVVLVTGGSRGIGRAVCRRFAEFGAKVYFFYQTSREQAESLEQEAKENQQFIRGFQVDVRQSDACEKAIEEILSENDRVDVLVNNSGTIRDNLLAMLSDDDVQSVLDTNVSGVFNVTRAVVPTMMRKRSGRIVNISSVSASKGGRGQSNYAASKGAVESFTKALAVELSPRNIRVNAVAPGVIETDMSKDVREMASDETLSRILLKRYGNVDDIAHAVTFLASPFADYITGEVLHVDGGFKMA